MAVFTFHTLKEYFTSASILLMPDPNRLLVVEGEAFDVSVGGVLSQRLHPCAFFSRPLFPTERNYGTGKTAACSEIGIGGVADWRGLSRSLSTRINHPAGLCHRSPNVEGLFSKMTHFVPLPKYLSAKETAQLVIQHAFHGLPQDVVSDHGP